MEEIRGRRVKAIPSAPPKSVQQKAERGWKGIQATTIEPRHFPDNQYHPDPVSDVPTIGCSLSRNWSFIPDGDGDGDGDRKFNSNSINSSVSTIDRGNRKSVSNHSSSDGNTKDYKSQNPGSSSKAVVVDSDRARVNAVLKEFHEILENKLREERRGKPGNQISKMRRANLHMKIAANLKRKWVNAAKRVGHVSGVQIGDKFRFRAELRLIGLHCQFDKGIDYLKDEMGREIATSVVATSTNLYSNSMGSSDDSITYSGEGGNPNSSGRKAPKDQKLERGNLALKNSMEDRKAVRVIFKRSIGNPEGGYVYHGLYFVQNCWKERGDFGNIIFKFQLKKLPG